MPIFLSVICATVLLGPGDSVPPVTAINTFLDAWHHAAAVADEAAYFNAMDSGSVYLGTDPEEFWSKQAFRDWAKPQFAKGTAWDLRPFGRHVTVARSGEIAWFDEKLKWFDTRLNTWMEGLRGTGVVRRTSQGWRVAQYNLTMELPNDRLGDVVHLLRVSKAVEPADRREIMTVVRGLLQAPATLDSSVSVVVATAQGSIVPRATWMTRTSRDSIAEVTLLGDGTIATLWAPFASYEETQRTGCGLAQFQLLKGGSGWRVTSLAVHQRERCPD